MAKGHFIDMNFSVNGKDGLTGFTKQSRLLVEGHKDLKGAFENVLSKLLVFLDRGYEQARIGHRWAKLKPSTIAYKQKYYPAVATKILVRTGALQHSITKKGTAGQILKINKKEMTFGTNIDYSIYHQSGTKNMARRPILPGIEYSKDKDHMTAMKKWHFGKVRELMIKGGSRAS